MTIETQLWRDSSSELKSFLEKEGVSYGVGIIGDSNDNNNTPRNQAIITEAFKLVQSQIGNFVLVSGGTKGGVPEMTLNIGQNLGLPTIGVYPEKESKYALKEKQKFSISVSSPEYSDASWGIETPTLISIPDAFILVGGEWGTLTEISMILKLNKARAKNKDQGVPSPLPPLPIIIVEDTGKIADHFNELEKYLPITENSVFRVSTSEDLANLLIDHFQ